MHRFATDRAYYPKPALALFGDVRTYFTIGRQADILRVIERHVERAAAILDAGRAAAEAEQNCAGRNRLGEPCRRQAVNGSRYCPTHRRRSAVVTGE